MTMHLAHPALSTTGKRKGKRKFTSADAAAAARANEVAWAELLKKHGVPAGSKNRKQTVTSTYNPPEPYRRSTPHIPSKISNWEPCTRAPEKVYTGTAIKGIATMHKSNAVPVFSQEDAIDIAKMRR